MIQNLSAFLWLFKILHFVLWLKCSYQEQNSIVLLWHASQNTFPHIKWLKSPVAFNLHLSFSMLWRNRCDRSHRVMKGANLAPRHTTKGKKSWKNQNLQTNKKLPTSAYKRSFTSHTGPAPQSTIHNNLLPSCLLMQTKGETTISGNRGRAKLILLPISF